MPTNPMSKPATAGPTTRLVLIATWLRAMPFARTSRGTSRGTNDWRAGWFTDMEIPMTTAKK